MHVRPLMHRGRLLGRYQRRLLLHDVESWNGSSWRPVPSPNVAPADNDFLLAVSCLSATSCTAAGYHYHTAVQTLIESWNGSRWAIVKSPNTSTRERNILYAVSCTSPTTCAAVGTHYVGGESPNNRTLIETWNGHAWTVAKSPNTSTQERNIFNAISCVTSDNCVAAGAYTSRRNGFNQTLIVTGSNSGWTIATSLNASTSATGEDNWLNGIACMSRRDCTAVGYYTTPKAVVQTLIESWNGKRWTIVKSPNP
jgi:hypothetical protein